VKDANGQSLAYVYARDTKADADIAKVLTMDEARCEQHRQAAGAAPDKKTVLGRFRIAASVARPSVAAETV
jgi:hypothetical protein